MSKSKRPQLVAPVILCGGSGTRLWPLSRSAFPKQFLVLSGDDSNQSLFQQAVSRINAIGNSQINLDPTLIVTNEEHRFLVLDQLRELKSVQVTLLLEPVGRNTAPALSLAALQATGKNGNLTNENMPLEESVDPILVITPADQTIQNQDIFVRALQDCVAVVAADQNKKTIAILAITPTSPETGYGYIERRAGKGMNNECDVVKFVEKPDLATAQSYLAQGDYLWNSGMFVLRASTWLSAVALFRPDIAKAAELAWHAKTMDQSGEFTFLRPDKDLFSTSPSVSIDYAVIEKCTVASSGIDASGGNEQSAFTVKMVELNAGWNDLGAWDAVWQVGKQDALGNVTSGDTLLENTKNSLVHASSRLVSTVGVENLIIVETADAVLVADRANSQDVKGIVSRLVAQQRTEKNLHRKVARPWGWYDSVDEGERFKVKRIQVKPGASLSLQMHHNRAEHWIVVKGIAEVTNGERVIRLQENESTFIPQGQTHRLSNPGTELLEIIEVQSGGYLGEDDIVRFEDTYGRS
jgi:mannose-1-phosphate guanylyltransferase/mannose-6-phosphate isomerase